MLNDTQLFEEHGFIAAEHDGLPSGEIDKDGFTQEQLRTNARLLYERAMKKETHAKKWADLGRTDTLKQFNAIARAINIDPKDEAALFALAPFRILQNEDSCRILAAYPCPREIGDKDIDHLGIDIILSWEPIGNTIDILGDAQPQFIGQWKTYFDNPRLPFRLFGDPRLFFQAWVQNRAQFWEFNRINGSHKWTAIVDEPDLIPGILAIGPIGKIRWPVIQMLPAQIACHGLDATNARRACFASAGLPGFSEVEAQDGL